MTDGGTLTFGAAYGSNPCGYDCTSNYKYRMYVKGNHNEKNSQDYDEVEDGGWNRWHMQSYFVDYPTGNCGRRARADSVEYYAWPDDPGCTALDRGSPQSYDEGGQLTAGISVAAGIPGSPFSIGAGLSYSFSSSDIEHYDNYNQAGVGWDISLSGYVPTGPDEVESDDEVDVGQGVQFNTNANCEYSDSETVFHKARFTYKIAPRKCGYTTLYETPWVEPSSQYETI